MNFACKNNLYIYKIYECKQNKVSERFSTKVALKQSLHLESTHMHILTRCKLV